MANIVSPNPDQTNETTLQFANEVHWIHKATFFSQIGLGIIGVIALIIYYSQLTEMKKATDAATKSNDLSRQALTSVQRAFVFVTTFDITRLYNPQTNLLDGRMRIAFQWENGGNTPTKDMTTHVSTRWFVNPLSEEFDFSDFPTGDPPLRMFVGPKSINRSAPIVVSAHDIAAIHNHYGHLYFWGWARYYDTSPKVTSILLGFVPK
jgi:hypothetical protein